MFYEHRGKWLWRRKGSDTCADGAEMLHGDANPWLHRGRCRSQVFVCVLSSRTVAGSTLNRQSFDQGRIWLLCFLISSNFECCSLRFGAVRWVCVGAVWSDRRVLFTSVAELSQHIEVLCFSVAFQVGGSRPHPRLLSSRTSIGLRKRRSHLLAKKESRWARRTGNHVYRRRTRRKCIFLVTCQVSFAALS